MKRRARTRERVPGAPCESNDHAVHRPRCNLRCVTREAKPAPFDLSSLLSVTPEAAFIASFVRKERLVIAGGDPLRAAPLLPMWMLERLVSSGELPAARLTVLRGGDVVPAATFRDADGRMRRDALDGLIAAGVSLVVADIDHDVPGIARLSDALALRLGQTVFTNAYVTHGEGGALAPHYDDHDVLVLQLHGAKRWFSHGTPTPSPVTPSPDGVDFGPAQWDTVVNAGDVLYLPRGEVHHTEVVTTPSVHLTFGIDTTRGVDLAAAILEDVANEPLFREDLTALGGEDMLREKEGRLKARLHACIDAADVSALLARKAAAKRR